MTRVKASVVALVVLAAFTLPQPAGAQLGGLIKKKVSDAVKQVPKKKETPQSATQPEETVQAMAPSRPGGFQRVSGDALVITPAMLQRLTRGMDAELAMQKEFQKEVAKYPTPKQYEDCKAGVAMSPEGQKIVSPMANLPENVSAEQLQAIIMKMGTEMEALQKKKCPLDPYVWNDSRRSEKLREIRTKAAENAKLTKPVAGSAPAEGTGRLALRFEIAPEEDWMLARVDTIQDTLIRITGVPGGTTDNSTVAGEPGLTEHEYSVMIERLVKFCEIKKSVDTKPKSGGLKYPGSGAGIFWVWTEEELRTLATFDCAAFEKKYKDLL